MKLILETIPKLEPPEESDNFIPPHINFLNSNGKKMREVYKRLKPKILKKKIKEADDGKLSQKEEEFNNVIETFGREIDVIAYKLQIYLGILEQIKKELEQIPIKNAFEDLSKKDEIQQVIRDSKTDLQNLVNAINSQEGANIANADGETITPNPHSQRLQDELIANADGNLSVIYFKNEFIATINGDKESFVERIDSYIKNHSPTPGEDEEEDKVGPEPINQDVFKKALAAFNTIPGYLFEEDNELKISDQTLKKIIDGMARGITQKAGVDKEIDKFDLENLTMNYFALQKVSDRDDIENILKAVGTHPNANAKPGFVETNLINESAANVAPFFEELFKKIAKLPDPAILAQKEKTKGEKALMQRFQNTIGPIMDELQKKGVPVFVSAGELEDAKVKLDDVYNDDSSLVRKKWDTASVTLSGLDSYVTHTINKENAKAIEAIKDLGIGNLTRYIEFMKQMVELRNQEVGRDLNFLLTYYQTKRLYQKDAKDKEKKRPPSPEKVKSKRGDDMQARANTVVQKIKNILQEPDMNKVLQFYKKWHRWMELYKKDMLDYFEENPISGESDKEKRLQEKLIKLIAPYLIEKRRNRRKSYG